MSKDYIQITVEEWLKHQGFSNDVISHPHAGEQYVQTVSDALKQFAKLVIDQTVQNCQAHCDTEIDTDGVVINTYRQFGF